MKTTLAALGLVFIVGCGAPGSSSGPSASAAPKFGDVVVTNDESTKTPVSSFAPDTPKIFVVCPFDNVKVGSKIKAAFVADKAEGAPPNYKIDEVDFDVTPIVNTVTASISMPNKGWPVGSYHVDLTLDGKQMATEKFSVAKPS